MSGDELIAEHLDLFFCPPRSRAALLVDRISSGVWLVSAIAYGVCLVVLR